MAGKVSDNPNEFLLPDLGEGLQEAELLEWCVKPGQTVNEFDTLAKVETDKALAGHLLYTAQQLASEQGCAEGFRLVMNCNELGGQTVGHIHMHVLGQRQLHWPPG